MDTLLPLEVDDEYYDDSEKTWKQPEGKVRLPALHTSRAFDEISGIKDHSI